MPPMEFPPEALDRRPVIPKRPNGELQSQESLPRPVGETAFSLLERDLPALVRLCDPWATEGLNIIAGRPKLGKTTLERQKLAAAATGSAFLDSSFTKPVKCAFLSLEEGPRLCRHKFLQAGFPEQALFNIELFFDWKRGSEGVFQLDRYLEECDEVRFVVIDSLTKFRAVPDPRTPSFSCDYEAVSALHNVSNKYPGRCIDVVHHTRKMKGDDPIDSISGTYGLTAAVDSYTVLTHHLDGAVMHVGGRLWEREENQFTLRRGERQTWEMLGVHLDITEKQSEALDLVKASPGGLSGKELGDKLGITQPSAWQRLDELLEKGLVVKRYGRVYSK
jgi:biotin operon repressor